MAKDEDHDGLIFLEAFVQVTKYLIISFDSSMALLRLRYDEFGDKRINILSLLYDMYKLRADWAAVCPQINEKEPLLEFADFPYQWRLKTPADHNKVLVNFCTMMKEKNVSADSWVSELVNLSRSNKIKTSVLLLRIIDIMDEYIFDKNIEMGASMDVTAQDAKPPLLRIFEVADALDILCEGSVLDYELEKRLGSFLNFELINFMSRLTTSLDEKQCDFKTFIDKSIVQGDNVNIEKLKDIFTSRNFSLAEVVNMFKNISIDHLTEINITKLQVKFDREMTILGVCKRPELVKQYIYGESASRFLNADDMGVGSVIQKIHESLLNQRLTFERLFGNRKDRVPREEFLSVYRTLINFEHPELRKLLEKIQDKRDPNCVNIVLLRSIYDSKYGKGGSEVLVGSIIETTIKNLRQTIAAMGHNVVALFNAADSDSTNSLDRQEFFFLLQKLDDTIKREEVNMIFEQIDNDRSGTIDLSEFEQFFRIDTQVLGTQLKVDKMKWATRIFQEITIRLEETGKTLDDVLPNPKNEPEVSFGEFKQMMAVLHPPAYLEGTNQLKFDNEIKVPSRSDRVDYYYIKSCLSIFRPVEKKDDVFEGVVSSLLSAFNNSPERVVEFLDIIADKHITRAEFCMGSKKFVKGYNETEIDATYSQIVGSVKINEISSENLLQFFSSFNKTIKERVEQQNVKANAQPISENARDQLFDKVRDKIRRFFNYDSTKFNQELVSFGREGRIQFSELLLLLSASTLKLTTDDVQVLEEKLRATKSTLLDADHVTSMIFYGKANLNTLNSLNHSANQQQFLQQVKNDINLYNRGSFDIYQNMDVNKDSRIDMQELFTACINMGLGTIDKQGLADIFSLISKGKPTFNLAEFRAALYGRQLENLGWLVFKIQEFCQTNSHLNLTPKSLFFKQEAVNPLIKFDTFSSVMREIDPNFPNESIDLLFSKMDGDSKGEIGAERFNNLMEEYDVINEFKDCLVSYAQDKGLHTHDVFNIHGQKEGMMKDEFKRFALEVTHSSLSLHR